MTRTIHPTIIQKVVEKEDHWLVSIKEGDIKLLKSTHIKAPIVRYVYSFECKGDVITKIMMLTADICVFSGDYVLLITRKSNPFRGMKALPGGIIDPGETPIIAAKRELKEETNLDCDIKDLIGIGIFDDPNRDPRNRHVISYVFSFIAPDSQEFRDIAEGLDDAEEAHWEKIEEAREFELAFDHSNILKEAISKNYFK